jgi:hypothetical protein
MAYLRREGIPFVLRLRENQYVRREGYVPQTLSAIAQGLRAGQSKILKARCRLGVKDDAPQVRLVLLRLGTGELLALACSGRPRGALAAYRARWTIESLFATLKTRGFNMEDTHITDHRKLSTLLALLTLAVAIAVKTGHAAAQRAPIRLKAHGRKACSVFSLGLTTLRKLCARLPRDQVFDALRCLIGGERLPNALIGLAR